LGLDKQRPWATHTWVSSASPSRVTFVQSHELGDVVPEQVEAIKERMDRALYALGALLAV